MLNSLNKIYLIFIIIVLIISIFFIPIISSYNISSSNDTIVVSLYGLVWPIPGYTKISSYFGNRTSPTAGASSYHSGIDIPAPEGTKLYAVSNGTISFASWGAGGGYTIVIELDLSDCSDNLFYYGNSVISSSTKLSVSYCHVSPIMQVHVGDFVEKNDIVGTVGPKNIYGILDNPYVDSNGNPTNGASTGSHLHFTIKVNNKAVNPLNYYVSDFFE